MESLASDSPAALEHVLFTRLQLPPLPPPVQRVVIAQRAAAPAVSPCAIALRPLDPPYTIPSGIAPPDALEALRPMSSS